MENNVVREETLYTYQAAISQYEREKHHAWLCNQKKLQKIRKEQQEKRKYFCNQKLCGGIIFILSIFLLVLTANAVMIAGMILGLYVMFTRKMIIVNDYWWKHDGLNQWKER